MNHLLGAVGVDPVSDVAVLIVEEVLLHFLGRLGLGREGVGRDTGIVDQDANALFLALDLVVDAGNVFLVRNVSLNGVNRTCNVFAVSLDDGVELLLGTTDNVNFGTVDGKGLSGHQTNTGTTT